MTSTVSFALFRGEDGRAILQRTQDISTVISARKPGQRGKPPCDACYLLLNNNNRVEVVGETVTSVFTKLEAGYGYRPAIVNELGQVAEDAIHPETEPEKEAANG